MLLPSQPGAKWKSYRRITRAMVYLIILQASCCPTQLYSPSRDVSSLLPLRIVGDILTCAEWNMRRRVENHVPPAAPSFWDKLVGLFEAVFPCSKCHSQKRCNLARQGVVSGQHTSSNSVVWRDDGGMGRDVCTAYRDSVIRCLSTATSQ